MKVSKQVAWQRAKKKQGRCQICGSGFAGVASQCLTCDERRSVEARNRYRRKRGIPLDAPLYTRSKGTD